MNKGSGNRTSIALGCWTNDDVVSVAVSSTREICDLQPKIRVIEQKNKQTHWLCLMIVLLKVSKLTALVTGCHGTQRNGNPVHWLVICHILHQCIYALAVYSEGFRSETHTSASKTPLASVSMCTK